ncbi:MAG: SDR family NAD(P)-dependent oxidoreductase [Geminicoccaceae bacterium]
MSGQLDGRRIIVTGGGRGIGAAMAKALAKEGGHLLIADINEGIASETRPRSRMAAAGPRPARSMCATVPASPP